MPKIYYFSKSHMIYEPINWSRLALITLSLFVVSSVATMICGYFGIDPLGLQALRADSISRENSVLKAQLKSLDNRLNAFAMVMNQLRTSDDQLRTSVNLPQLSADVRKVSVGGVELNGDYGVSAGANKLISGAMNTLEVLKREAKLQEVSYSNILARYKTNQQLFRHIPAIDPIRDGIITDRFGMRFHPILHILLMHEGIDLGAEVGTHVHATGDGVVSYVGRRGGYGNVIVIDNGFGYSTLFGHLSKALVKPGQNVKRGQVIALSGDTGLSTGPHLHYEVRKNGVHVDPTGYFFNGTQFNTANLYSQLVNK
ncbi:MAG: M23 family metallopeptidase [Bacteroidetes bacterium]|nr:M23 family metallopeptidase [Bacteroidota bacterium]